MVFSKNEADMHHIFVKEVHARTKYSEKIRMKRDITAKFYKEDKK